MKISKTKISMLYRIADRSSDLVSAAAKAVLEMKEIVDSCGLKDTRIHAIEQSLYDLKVRIFDLVEDLSVYQEEYDYIHSDRKNDSKTNVKEVK